MSLYLESEARSTGYDSKDEQSIIVSHHSTTAYKVSKKSK